ncbi:uncharacterized protein [Pempheris klunzingeri]|uniref:uncharacterized protein n=1 Tax=Pempheris klunzingeri TaxID=3127111 RepID=UPI0039812DCC
MKMRTLLFGVILGFLAVVHSTPINTVTLFPTNSEDEVVREALTDGFLFDHDFLSSHTTESPKINKTVQASPEPSESKESDVFEGSADGVTSIESTTSTFPMTLIVSHAPKSSSDMSSTLSPQSGFTSSSVPNEAQSSITPDMELGSGLESLQYTTKSFSVTSSSTSSVDTEHSSSGTSTTQSPTSGFTSSTLPNEYVAPDHVLVSQITERTVHSTDSGSEDEKMPHQYTTTSSSPTSSSNIETSTSMAFGGFDGLDVVVKAEGRSLNAPQVTLPIVEEPEAVGDTPSNKGHTTPSWIIIVGFIAGVAALVMLCVAIATRDKWNGPKHVSQQETKINSANQQREVEMETFMHKDEPKENGKAAEYTVIPLDELPEKYSSH